MAVLLASCGEVEGAPPGFSADTASWRGLASGATATEAACRALVDGLWVQAGRRRACLRFAVLGTPRPGRGAVVILSGDPPSAAYGSAGGRVRLHRLRPGEAPSLAGRVAAVDAASLRGQAAIILARPGMEGSSGDHAQDRHSLREVALVNDALSQLSLRYGFGPMALAGFSSGGTLAANLLARRDDIRCAALDSAPLDLAAFYRRWDGTMSEHTATRGDLADPMRIARQLDGAATIWVLGDANDRKVPAALWTAWAATARSGGARVLEASTGRLDGERNETHHEDAGLATLVASECLAGRPEAEIRAALDARRRGTVAR